jgi:uncharacterized protein (DUF362 family)
MVTKVAIVSLEQGAEHAFSQALKLVGKIDDLNTPKRSVTIKVGVFDPKSNHHTTVEVVDAIIKGFSKTPTIHIVESDNYRGKGSVRLQKWKSLFSERVIPFSLSEDAETRQVKIAGEDIQLSHVLFRPNVLVSTHVLRTYDQGSVLKNLLGVIPDRRKVRFHKKLGAALMDAYEAIGGIDLAVLDGTHAVLGVGLEAKQVPANLLAVGRDAVAVEVVGATIMGLDPEKVPVIQEAMNRGIGESNIDKIELVGASLADLKEKSHHLSAK